MIATIANWITASKQALSDAPQLGNVLSDAFRNRVLAKAHDLRNLAEYEGHVDVEQRLVTDVIAACEAVAARLDASMAGK